MKELRDIAYYVNDKIKVNDIDYNDYISTDNMLPNKEGITETVSCPESGSVTRYKAGDVLVSNIRPYFKKIWFADKDGGCSNDVIVFRPLNRDETDNRYLYYLLSQDAFFDFMMAGANGTKMPRGNKKLIPQFPIPDNDLPTQRKIASILSAYDDLIDNNLKQIKLLEEAAQRLYTEWFVDLHFPEYENTPFVDGLPKGWKNEKIGNFVEYFDKKRKPLSSMQRASMQKLYPYYGASSLMDYVDDYIFDGIYLLMGEDGTVITPDNFPILQYIWGKFWVNNHAHVLRGKNGISTEFLYIHFKKMPVTDVVTGVAQPKISQGRLSDKKVVLPSIDLIKKWSDLTKPFFEQIRNLSCAITQLQEARDILLPRLMSGELNVE